MKPFRFIFTLIHVLLFFVLMGVLMNAYVSPHFFPYFNLLSLAFPGLLIVYVLLCLFWMVLWKKRALVFLILGLFFYKPVLRWVNFNTKSKENATLKVVSFNNKSKKDAEEYLNHQNADIVFLQESGTENASRPEIRLKYVTDHDWLLSIHSRYKILEQGILFDPKEYTGNMQYADVEIDGQRIRLINIYLEPYSFEKKKLLTDGDFEQDEAKAKFIIKRLLTTYETHATQVEEIKKFIEQTPYPIILCGDFNAVPNSYEYYQLVKGLNDGFIDSGSGLSTSFHDYKIPIRIDYIFSSKTIKALSYKVDRTVHISDHYPVIAQFKLVK